MISTKQRYTFAHKILPQMFLQVPIKFLMALLDPSESLLTMVWDSIGARLAENGEPREHGPAVFVTEIHRVRGYNVVIAKLQRPLISTECHFVAFAYRPAGNGLRACARYITLEKAYGSNGESDETFVCEWTSEGHVNCGYGVRPTAAEFAAVLGRVLGVERLPYSSAYRKEKERVNQIGT